MGMKLYEDLVFIEMCEKAVEIQATKGFLAVGDYWCWASLPETVYQVKIEPIVMEDRRIKRRNYKIWLPTQSDMDGMIDEQSPHKSAMRFSAFANPARHVSMQKAHFVEDENGYLDLVPDPEVMNQAELDYPKQFTSTEQLKLAFVYKQNYNKVWVDGDWRELE